MSQQFSSPPPSTSDTVLVSFPAKHVLLVTFNIPKQLNALPRKAHLELARLWTWYDGEPTLRCAVITGKGKAFCAGANLREWHEMNQKGVPSYAIENENWLDNGFGGMSNRRGKKPIIAAVNGFCFGGGFEMMVNSDCVIASESAKFGLPEVLRGIAPIAGALPRLIRIIGRQRASEMILLGRTYDTTKLYEWGIVNKVVAQDEVLAEALRWASEISENSPDAVILARAGLMGGWDGEEPTSSANQFNRGIFQAVDGGVNMKEGMKSFVEKRKAVWVNSKL